MEARLVAVVDGNGVEIGPPVPAAPSATADRNGATSAWRRSCRQPSPSTSIIAIRSTLGTRRGFSKPSSPSAAKAEGTTSVRQASSYEGDTNASAPMTDEPTGGRPCGDRKL